MRLETKRVILRNFEKNDLNDLYEYCSQDGVGEMAGWKHHTNINESKELLDRFVENNNTFAIENKEDKRVIGHITIMDDFDNEKEEEKELGFVLNRNYHNQGIMSEVIYQILEYIFSKDVECMYACCISNNKPSKRLIEKCGFTFVEKSIFYAESLNKNYILFEYVYNKNNWLLQK